MLKSTAKSQAKPPKPCLGFPLFAHATGWWAKKVKGKLVYFGPWDDPDAVLQKYLDQKDDLYAGRTPRPKSDGLELRDLHDRFLTAKQRRLELGELKPKTFGDYHACAARIIDVFGARGLVADLAADDFGRLQAKLAKVLG